MDFFFRNTMCDESCTRMQGNKSQSAVCDVAVVASVDPNLVVGTGLVQQQCQQVSCTLGFLGVSIMTAGMLPPLQENMFELLLCKFDASTAMLVKFQTHVKKL